MGEDGRVADAHGDEPALQAEEEGCSYDGGVWTLTGRTLPYSAVDPPWGRTLVDPTGFCGSGCASGAVQLQCIYNFCVWSGHSQSYREQSCVSYLNQPGEVGGQNSDKDAAAEGQNDCDREGRRRRRFVGG